MFGMSAKKKAAKERRVVPGSVTVTDREARERLAFLGLTERDLGVISAWRSECEGALDPLIDAFYAHIARQQQTRQIIEKHTTVERQRPMVKAYILTMFQGRVDDQYLAYRQRVGKVHDNIDLDSNWYVAMYEIIRRFLTEAVAKVGTEAEVAAFSDSLGRLIQTDIALVVTALTDSRRDKLQAEGRKASQFVDALGSVLERVADRDLTARVKGDVPTEYERVATSLNHALEALQRALSDVAQSAEQVAGASHEITSGSHNLSNGASAQAASLQEVSANMSEVSSQTSLTVQRTEQARAATEAATQTVREGEDAMQRLAETIDRIRESSERTAKIVKSIDEIAFQTNLLALNAAVEAARAGDAGRGFAVVAEEVRALAMRSAEAAKNTSELIEESRRFAGEGVTAREEVGGRLQTITAKVNEVQATMLEIAAAAREQEQGLSQITRAMDQVNSVTQQVAANAEESAAAAIELSSQAESMQTIVGGFTLDDQHGKASLHVVPGRAPSRAPARRLAGA